MPNLPGNDERFRVTGPITYIGQAAVQQDIETFEVGAAGPGGGRRVHHRRHAHAPDAQRPRRPEVLPAATEEYLYALADAMHEEYQAITDAGFILQLDLAPLNPRRRLQHNRKPTREEMTRAMELAVEVRQPRAARHPRGAGPLPPLLGQHEQPAHPGPPLRRDRRTRCCKIKAQAYGVEAANPRHEHEWMVWQDVKLPDGKILIPGLISHQTNVVEHPELVAWRIKNFASVVGKENVIAGADCGFSQYWDSIRVHPTVQWAKLQALVEGAALASRELWS